MLARGETQGKRNVPTPESAPCSSSCWPSSAAYQLFDLVQAAPYLALISSSWNNDSNGVYLTQVLGGETELVYAECYVQRKSGANDLDDGYYNRQNGRWRLREIREDLMKEVSYSVAMS